MKNSLFMSMLILMLTACGGGGVGYPYDPSTIHEVGAPAIVLGATTPKNGEANVKVDQVVSIEYALSANAAVESSSVTLTCAGTKISDGKSVPGTTTLDHIVLDHSKDLPRETTCTISGTITAKDKYGSVSLQVNVMFTTEL
jgi:hypothetical protein